MQGYRTNKKDKCEKVEVWYYNCGDNDFIYTLTFEDNILTGENTEGRVGENQTAGDNRNALQGFISEILFT